MSGWYMNRWTRLFGGVVIGAIVGLAIFGADRLTGPLLFIVAGAVGGVVAAFILQFYSRSVRLTDITVSVPQFSQLRFAVTRDSQLVAWKLFVESVTRISTQTLSSNEGILREALTSLYGLFAITREALKEAQPSTKTGRDPSVEHLAIAMLNNELRPFLSHWHPVLAQWEKENTELPESAWPLSAECRAQLAAVQQRLRAYVLGFGRLAGLPNSDEILRGILGEQFDPDQ
jgi:uncharacterized membrane protein YeaQ/YmgE (transglycosylase-associated protein family)